MPDPATTRPPRPRRGDEVEVTIESLAHGGAGVGRADGFVVFVRGTVPGDRVRAEIGKSKKSFAEARVIEIVEPSPDRIEPESEHPGAPWQVLPYERQIAEKEQQVRDALERLGGFDALHIAVSYTGDGVSSGFTLSPAGPAAEPICLLYTSPSPRD